MSKTNVMVGILSNHRKKEGITLIALVITIIVMLILAGVSIAIAINGGLFTQAQKAAELTNIAMLKERLAVWQSEQLAQEYTGINARSLETFLDELVGVKLISAQEKEAILADADNSILMGGERISFKPIVERDVASPTATLSYSNTATTSAPVTVTMTTSEEIVTPNGWTKVDTTHYTRIYTINLTDTITVSDLSGNIGQVSIAIANINTTSPNGNVSYSTDVWTNGNITVTMTTNKEIATPSGWTKVDNTHYTKVYTASATENVTITDLLSNTGTVSVAVTKIDKEAPTVNAFTATTNMYSIMAQVGGSDNGGSGITLYTIEYKKTTDSTYSVETAATSATSISEMITNLESGTQYDIRAKVTDGAGNSSPYSSVLSVSTSVCFVAGTKVSTPDGLINIEDLEIGDEVYTFNEDTQLVEIKEILNTSSKKANIIMQIKFANEEVIENTTEHPYYIVGKGWTNARNLQIGDKVLTKDMKELAITEITTKEMDIISVYNLAIKDNYNYFVGTSTILVHNAGGCTVIP